MPVQKAMIAYKEEKLNCAQSVLRGFQKHKSIPEDTIIKAKALGGGRAEEGLCGALHAALTICENDNSKKQISESFFAKAGSHKCREIRSKNTISCKDCVELAAKLLDEEEKKQ